MRLRAQITVEIDAKDFVEAADHQRRLEEFLRDLRREYGQAALHLVERRERAGAGLRPSNEDGPRRLLPPSRRL
jgi:hypothetical protein